MWYFDELAERVKLQMTGKNTRSCSTFTFQFASGLASGINNASNMTYENEQTKHQSETKLQNYTTYNSRFPKQCCSA